MAGRSREQALPLLATANNHGDLAVKLSSLRQAKEILLSLEPSLAADLFPYLVELQASPESLVRKCLIEVIEDVALKSMAHSSILMHILLNSLRDKNSTVAKQSIISGTSIFCCVLEELLRQRGSIERWIEELWMWMVKFKDAVFRILFEEGVPVGTKLLAIKFVETCVLLFTSDANDPEKSLAEAIKTNRRTFNISWLIGSHPVLDPVALASDATRCVGFLLDLLGSASLLPGSLTISVVNSLVAVARRRPVHFNRILHALFNFDPNLTAKGSHTASIQYSLRTAFLGFLRCTHPVIMESRERLLKALRAMDAGDAADQVLRQVDKMMRNNERAARDARLSKDEHPSNHLPPSGDLTMKRPLPLDREDLRNSLNVSSKRMCFDQDNNAVPAVEQSESGHDYVNEGSPKLNLLDGSLTPVEQMLSMIGALLAEGERAIGSIELVISNIPSDLLADIVIENMKFLSEGIPPVTRLDNLTSSRQSDSSNGPIQVVSPIGSTNVTQTAESTTQIPISTSNTFGSLQSDAAVSINAPSDSRRDPRRDPRRLDPRRPAAPAGVPSTTAGEDNTNAMLPGFLQHDADPSSFAHKTQQMPLVSRSENVLVPLIPKTESVTNTLVSPKTSGAQQAVPEEVHREEPKAVVPDGEVNVTIDTPVASLPKIEQETVAPTSSAVAVVEGDDSPALLEADQHSPAISSEAAPEDQHPELPELPALPSYVNLSLEQQMNVRKSAVEQIVDSYKKLQGPDCMQTGMALLARLVGQIDDDDGVIVTMQKHIFSDYQHQKGHELVMHALYYLHALMISDSGEGPSITAVMYEKFLLGVAKYLLDTLPATDKSFSRLLGEVPYLPSSALDLLYDICSENYASRDGDRITQGLGTVWSLILGRPPNREACLDIALKCAVHSQDDIRTKAIRLVSNKLYGLGYLSQNIEDFATNMFLSAVEQRLPFIEQHQSRSFFTRTEQVEKEETSASSSQITEPGIENDSKNAQMDSQIDSSVSFSQAQCLASLLFALCTKKPSLLRLVFDHYERAPKAVKQAVHRHVPVLIRAIGPSCSGLLSIISDPPRGSENLLTQVLQVLSEEMTPPSDLVATVKHLYETKLKDATILIPVLSSFSKVEVLPIFPRLVGLPLDKFQTALAHILQGSAHTGPALTPVEVLVAIHDINPERNGVPLKKITDVCSACFEQRTVFTQQVLAKALNHMVDQTPLPLLFMRTVIQAIDAYPNLVDFVMEILSKLVSKQVWRMPKLWVGFLKCISQTQPHSFPVLLQLPSPQLESALNKYPNLRGPLAAFASQNSIRSSLSRFTLAILGLANEAHLPNPHHPSSLHASDTSSSVHGAAMI